ncbi:haloacid dehalogenase [Amycolatopsis antarctica]|uniref:Haloacid dehalogenase n=2 Tax=Amycolatopsis antarctica TaxID=1854586 RepID=A0A263CZM4_9PSEU|nr:haloacid dehalogenase [Amycolatopsis antarctica]
MTLIDPRPGMAALMDTLGAEVGMDLQGERFAANLGPPLDMVLRERGVPEDRLDEFVARFRALYPEVVIPATVALPGAAEALAAIRRDGDRILVVTGKYGPNAQLHVNALGFEVDHLVGELWAAGKAQALVEQGAAVYVGDHRGDMVGALAAGVVGIGVTTGPCSRADLLDAGAEVVLGSLRELPAWLSANIGRFTLHRS